MKFNRDRHSRIRTLRVEECNEKLFTFIHSDLLPLATFFGRRCCPRDDEEG